MTRGIFEFVLDHTDNCPRCSMCDFCDEGKRLMRAAADLGAALLLPTEEALHPKAKA